MNNAVDFGAPNTTLQLYFLNKVYFHRANQSKKRLHLPTHYSHIDRRFCFCSHKLEKEKNSKKDGIKRLGEQCVIMNKTFGYPVVGLFKTWTSAGSDVSMAYFYQHTQAIAQGLLRIKDEGLKGFEL